MISLFRVDEKLLHGRVIYSWLRNIDIQTILLADDSVANDAFMRMTFGLAKPSNVELLIYDIRTSIEYLKQHQSDRLSIMVITANLKDAKQIIDELKFIDNVNIGYIQKQGKYINESITLAADDIKICEELRKRKIILDFRESFENESFKFEELL